MASASSVQLIRASSTVIFVRVFQAFGRLRGECGSAFTHGGQGIHIHGCAFLGQTVEEFAGGLTAGQLDGQGSDDRAIVQTLADLEHVGAGCRSPAQIARMAGAAPRHFGKLEKGMLYQPMGTASSTFLGRILP